MENVRVFLVGHCAGLRCSVPLHFYPEGGGERGG
nr:MAG TPA: PGAP1-like protein [Caudoviricetes sp.]